MRNHLFVIGLTVPAIAFLVAGIYVLTTDSAMLAVVPLGLAAVFVYGAFKVARAEPFSSPRKDRFQYGSSADTSSWQRGKDDRETARSSQKPKH